MKIQIEIRNVSKSYGAFSALKDVSLEVPSGQLVALLGPSGSGKTTLLRIIAGLEAADKGQVLYENDDVTRRAVREREVGFVFQHYALFSHMNIFENIAFGLRVRKWKKADVKERVHELLKLIQLEGLEKRYPSQLSGGQRQRVALARALAPQPKVLLLDEPFGALDAKVRQDLRRWLRKLHDEIHVTSVFVTHDQEEAFEVADHVVVMNKGRVEQLGSPDEVFARPSSAFVMDFLGSVNVFEGRVQNGRATVGGFDVPFPEYQHAEPQTAKVFIRPHEVEIDRQARTEDAVAARVVRINRSGSFVKVALEKDDGTALDVELDHERDRNLKIAVEDKVYLYPRQVRVFLNNVGTEDKAAHAIAA